MATPLLIQTAAVAAGGAVGASLRFLTNRAVARFWQDAFPLATLLVNAAGSLALGYLTAYFMHNAHWPVWIRVALGAGVMGALTTFSTFSLETVLLLESGAYTRAALNILLNVGVCLAAVALGFHLAR